MQGSIPGCGDTCSGQRFPDGITAAETGRFTSPRRAAHSFGPDVRRRHSLRGYVAVPGLRLPTDIDVVRAHTMPGIPGHVPARPLSGMPQPAADLDIGHLGPMLALQPRKRFATDTVLIVDGTLALPAASPSPSARRTTGTPTTTTSQSMPLPAWSPAGRCAIHP